MSQSAVPLNVMGVYEPRMELNNERTWVVVKGGQTVTYYPFPSTSYSANQFNFICNPPSAQTVLDRSVFIQVPVTLTFTASGVGDPGLPLLQANRDAFRAFPLSSVTNTLTAVINGFPVNIELSQIIHCLSRFHNYSKLKNGWMSLQPCYEDNYQSYQDADGANNNPLGVYSHALDGTTIPRGAYNGGYAGGFAPYMQIVSNTTAGAVINAVLLEQVFLPPFLWDDCEAGGLVNLTSLTFNWILNNNLARMWSHSDVTDVAGASTIGALSVAFGQPSMYLGFITPRLNQIIPPRVTYPYFQVSRYTTQTGITLAPNQQISTFKSNIIQLDSIPRKLYMFLKESDLNVYLNLHNMLEIPDVFASINAINITWNNQQGVLSGASPANLYQFSSSNGYNKSWTEWNGFTQQFAAANSGSTKVIGLEGSIVCVEMSKDIGLNDTESEGVLGNFNLQVQMTATNPNQYRSIMYDMYIIAVYDGTLVVSNTSAMASIGVVTREEVLNAPINHNIGYHELQSIYGGNFFSKFKDFLGKANNFLKDSKAISTISGLIPHPASQGISAIARNLGYGDGYGTSMGAEKAWATRRKEFGKKGHRASAYGHGVLAGDGVLYGGQYDDDEIYGGEELSHEELRNNVLHRLGH